MLVTASNKSIDLWTSQSENTEFLKVYCYQGLINRYKCTNIEKSFGIQGLVLEVLWYKIVVLNKSNSKGK